MLLGLGFVTLHSKMPIFRKPPVPPVFQVSSFTSGGLVKFSFPDVDGHDLWGPIVGPDRPACKARLKRSSKRGEGSRIRRRFGCLAIGNRNPVPSNGVNPGKSPKVVAEAFRFLAPCEASAFTIAQP